MSVTAESVAKHTSTTDRQVFAQGSQQSVRVFKLSYGSMKSLRIASACDAASNALQAAS